MIGSVWARSLSVGALALISWLAACKDFGPEPLPITPDGAKDVSPAWSPDGRFIAIRHEQDQELTPGLDKTGLYLVEVETGDRHFLGINGAGPAWSPDGRYLYYTVPWAIQLARFDLITGVDTLLTEGPHWDRFPSVSPDGKRVALSSGYGSPMGLGPPVLQLMDLDGSNRRRIFPPEGDTLGVGRVSWDPTGRYLVYERFDHQHAASPR